MRCHVFCNRANCLINITLVVLFNAAADPTNGQRILQRLPRGTEPQVANQRQSLIPIDPSFQRTQIQGPRSTSSGYLGLVVDDLTGLTRGILVLSVRKGGPAENAGLQRDDVIGSIDQHEVTRISEMAKILGSHLSGDRITVTYLRGKTLRSTEITLADRSAVDETKSSELYPPNVVSPLKASARAYLGVHVASPSTAVGRLAGRLLSGAIVTRVQTGSPAERYGIPLGARIIAMNEDPITTAEDLIQWITLAQANQVVAISYFDASQLFHRQIILGGFPQETTTTPQPIDPTQSPPILAPANGLPTDRLEHPLQPPLPDDKDSVVQRIEQLEAELIRLRTQLKTSEKELAKLKAGLQE